WPWLTHGDSPSDVGSSWRMRFLVLTPLREPRPSSAVPRSGRSTQCALEAAHMDVEVVIECFESADISFKAAEDDDPVVVGLVSVVEDEVVRGGVVAEVGHVWVCSIGLVGHREPLWKRSGLLDAAVISHRESQRQLCEEVPSCL